MYKILYRLKYVKYLYYLLIIRLWTELFELIIFIFVWNNYRTVFDSDFVVYQNSNIQGFSKSYKLVKFCINFQDNELLLLLH